MNRRQTLLTLPALAAASALPHMSIAQTTSMQTRKIPSSGEALPVIGLGTWQTFDVNTTEAARAPLRNVMREFAALGGRVIDSSPMYGRSEEVAGDLINQVGARHKMFVATKVWTQGQREGVAQMRDSIAKLRVPNNTPIDLMQVHNLVDVNTHLATLDDWKAKNFVRYVGMTHYTESAYDEVARVIERAPRKRIHFLQINYSVAERGAEKRLLPLARDRGLAVIINRPFAGGELIRRLRAQPLPAFAAEIGATSWAQLLLKFVLSHTAVTCAIPATSKVEHLRDNMQAGSGAMPNEAQRLEILKAVQAA
jgi:aryl-alcohol dehydrogenase-like predicted oxidoreductase